MRQKFIQVENLLGYFKYSVKFDQYPTKGIFQEAKTILEVDFLHNIKTGNIIIKKKEGYFNLTFSFV